MSVELYEKHFYYLRKCSANAEISHELGEIDWKLDILKVADVLLLVEIEKVVQDFIIYTDV